VCTGIRYVVDGTLCRAAHYPGALYHAFVGARNSIHYYHTDIYKKMKTYFFKVGNQPAQECKVSVEGLCTGDNINLYTLQKMAEHHAKLLASLYDVTIKFWPKEKPENVVSVERNAECLILNV
jgi:hypothetical protein